MRADGKWIALMAMVLWVWGCGSEVPTAAPQGAGDHSSVEGESAALAEPAAESQRGRVQAKANEKSPETEFDVKTAVVTHYGDRFCVCLSDIADDEVRDLGQFPPAKDDLTSYHRMVLVLESAPNAPGTISLTRLEYSVKDPEAHFNFGWPAESIDGTVTVDSMAGELPEGPGRVAVRPATMTGSFQVSNTYGGHFSGNFVAEGYQVP